MIGGLEEAPLFARRGDVVGMMPLGLITAASWMRNGMSLTWPKRFSRTPRAQTGRRRRHRTDPRIKRTSLGMGFRWLPFLVVLLVGETSFAQQFHRQSFEANDTRLKLGLTNGQIELLEQNVIEDKPHSGKRAERIFVRVTSGDFALVEYAIEPAMIIEELEISAFVSASRAGTQIQARVVLPGEIDPETGKPQVTLLTGSGYDTTERYRKLVISRLDKLLARQQQLLQAQRGRAVDVRGAYVDQVVFNIMSGLGEYEVRFDDIVVGPIVPRINGADADPAKKDSNDQQVPLNLRGEDGQKPHAMVPEVSDRNQLLRAEIRSEQLFVGSKVFFPRGMVRTQAPLRVFRETGMNLVFEPFPIAGPVVDEAAALNLLLVPMLPLLSPNGGGGVSFANHADVASTFNNQSIFFYVGGPLDRSTLPSVQATVAALRDRDRAGDRILTGDVAEDVRDYSRKLDMVGTAKFPLMTSLSVQGYQQWVRDRKTLALPGTFVWSWIQTHPPREFVRLAYGHDIDERPLDNPTGPHPQQIRMLTYATLAQGSRGLVFTSDRWLGESVKGRARTLGLALLNSELTLIEPFIADGTLLPYGTTSNPNIGVAYFKHNGGRGVLAIAYWKDPSAQMVMGQSAVNNLQFIVRGAPESSQAFEISPAEVRGVKRQRQPGGILVTLDEFDTAAFVVLTPDAKLFANYQELVQQTAEQATTWQHELAEIELSSTETTNARLQTTGHPSRDATPFITESRKLLAEAKAALAQKDYRTAYTLNQRSMRYARELQLSHWKQAVKDPSLAVSSPFSVSFYTLPEHYAFLDAIERSAFSRNQLPSGDFEIEGSLDAAGWSYDPHTDEDLEASALLIPASAKKGGRVLELRVASKSEEPPATLDATKVTITSSPVRVEAGQIVRITGMIRVPANITGSVDGAMVWDSLGGESLALRFTKMADWKEFELSRPVRESGELRLNLVMTGLGTVELDDLSIELANPVAAPVAERPTAERSTAERPTAERGR